MTHNARRPVVLALILLTATALTSSAQPVDADSSLATLGRIWGLLKYHPGSTRQAGADERLLAAIPRFKAAGTRGAIEEEVASLLRQSGQAFAFRSTPKDVGASVALGPAVQWIDGDPNLSPSTRTALKDVVLAHRGGANQYIGPAGVSGNPDFSRDIGSNTPVVAFPSEDLRLLALFRYWNMVQYFFPCVDVIDRDWSAVLNEMVPVFRQASSALEYHLAVMRLTANINDAHAVTSSPTLSAHWGAYFAPLQVRLVEGRTVVTRVYTTLTNGADVRAGDVVTQFDGVAAEARRDALRPFIYGSNVASLERNIHALLTRSAGSVMTVVRERDGAAASIVLPIVDFNTYSPALSAWDATNLRVSAVLEGNTGYVNMGLLQRADVPGVMNGLRNTRAIVFDLRNYPNTTLYDILNYLNPSARPFVRFTQPDYDNPGALKTISPLTAGPGSTNAWFPSFPPYFKYDGRVVVLLNQETQSQAEYTAMAFKTVTGAILIGSQTAGADGNVSLITLPGGITTYFSGLGVFYPDGRPTQRIGIVPDRIVTPTIAGLRAGRDEVLEAALQIVR